MLSLAVLARRVRPSGFNDIVMLCYCGTKQIGPRELTALINADSTVLRFEAMCPEKQCHNVNGRVLGLSQKHPFMIGGCITDDQV